MAPDLIGIPTEDKLLDVLGDDVIFLSPAAMEWLGVKQGDLLQLRAGTQTVTLRIAGGLRRARAGQRLGVMDIAAVQWQFQRIGQLSRIELKLMPGVNREEFKETLERELKPYGEDLITETADQEARVANMSRAYGVNLNLLALVALFTGTFLVFSTQALWSSGASPVRAVARARPDSQATAGADSIEGTILGTIGSFCRTRPWLCDRCGRTALFWW